MLQKPCDSHLTFAHVLFCLIYLSLLVGVICAIIGAVKKEKNLWIIGLLAHSGLILWAVFGLC